MPDAEAADPSKDQPRRPSELSDRDMEILAFERQWWQYPGHKVNEMRSKFNKGEFAYWLEVSRLIDRPEAEAHDPLTVKRLRRMRAERMRSRRVQGRPGSA